MYFPVWVAITVPGFAAPRRKPPGAAFVTDPYPVPVPEPPVGNVDTRDLVFIELLFLSAWGVFLSEVIFLFYPLTESSLLFDFWFCNKVTGEADLILALAVASYEVALYLPLGTPFLFTGDSGRLPTEAAVVDEGLSSSRRPPFCMGFEEPGLWGILQLIMGFPLSWLWKDLVWAESVDLY